MSTVSVQDVSTTEGTFQTPDGHALYTKTWTPSVPLQARLVFIHGFSDHGNFYGILFPTLAQQGIKVYAYDQRGWGRSVHQPSDKGNTGPTSQILQDLAGFITSLPQEEADIPLYLMGHSMGGAEVLYFAATAGPEITSRIRGYLCESPFVKLHPAAQPFKITEVLGRWAGKILPRWTLLQKLDAQKLCRDPEVCKEWEADPLNHDTGTLECLAAMLDRASALEEHRVVVKEGEGEGGKTRLWIGFGTADAIVSFDACRKWFDAVDVEDKEFKVYEGWYHKLHSEPGEDKFKFAKDVSDWILARAGPLDNLPSAKPKL